MSIRDMIRKRRYAQTKGFLGKASITTTGSRGWNPVMNIQLVNHQRSYDDRALAEYYSKSSLIWACVRELATSIASFELEVGTEDSEGVFEPQPDNEILGLFTDNPWYSYGQLIELWIARLYLTGAQVSLKVPFENRPGFGALLPYPTSVVNLEADGINLLGYRIGDTQHITPPEEVLEHRFINPGNYHTWTSPLATAIQEVAVDEERNAITREILRNKNVPAFFIKPPQGANSSQRKQLQDSLDAASGGSNANRGKGVVLPPDVEVDMGPDVKDIDWKSMNGLTESRICMAFGVPPIIMGAKVGIETSTYANYETARESYYKETLVPLATFLTSGFNRQLVEDGIKFRFNLDNVPELQEDINQVAVRAAQLFEKKVATKNEAREMVGLPPVDGGDEFPEPPPMLADNNGDEDDGENPFEETADESDEGKVHGKKEPKKAPAAIGSFPEAVPLEQALKKEFKKQKKRVMDSLEDNFGDFDPATIGLELGDAVAGTLFSVASVQANKNLAAVLTAAGATEDVVTNAFDVVNPMLEARIKAQTIKLSAETEAVTTKKLSTVTETIRKELIANQVRGPASIRALEEGIAKVFDEADRYRARRIAVTESSRALADADIISGEASGVVTGFRPLVSSDACDICQVYDGDTPTGQALWGWTSLEDAKAQVDTYDNRSLPPFHPNCRCSLEPILDIDEQPTTPSRQKREQGGKRPSETPRPRPGGRPEPTEGVRELAERVGGGE
jgi:HK97 family phage portal protein